METSHSHRSIAPIAHQLLDPTCSMAEHDATFALLANWTTQEWIELFELIMRQGVDQATHGEALGRLGRTFLHWTHRRAESSSESPTLEEPLLVVVRDLYLFLGGFQLPRHDLLSALAVDGRAPAIELLGTLFRQDPPRGAVAAAAPIAILFRARRARAELLFPDLLDALIHVEVAPAILDLANFLTRQNRLAPHPATDRATQLMRLLEGIVAGLEQIQHATHHGAQFDVATQQKLSDGLSLSISICDALGLIGDHRALSCLSRVAQLQHRRLRVEALAAMSRLNDLQAKQDLAELASEPAVRLRVLAYAEELGLNSYVKDEYQTPEAIAAAELVALLAGPTKMGVPPSSCELIDTRTQYWPGYEEPRVSFLFRYVYRLADANSGAASTYQNIGIAGPVVQALQADLCDLPLDDIYAVYAGWHAEHDELYETDWNIALEPERRVAERWIDDLEQEGFHPIASLFVAHFFGDLVLIATAERDGVAGTLIVDEQGVAWHPHLASRGAMGPVEFYCLYKGRRLLRAFNAES